MVWWLVAVALCCLLWAGIWKSNVVLALGVLIGLLLAWPLSNLLEPYVTGMEDIPIWLPPLPLATVATLLFVYGALIWLRGNDRLPKGKHHDPDEH
jgi:ABC-type sulfate transport system permease component